MKRIGVWAVLLSALAGCHSDTKIDYLNRIYTTAEYLNDEALRAKVISTCDANDGELLSDPNCVNARMAELQIAQVERQKEAQKEIDRLNSAK